MPDIESSRQPKPRTYADCSIDEMKFLAMLRTLSKLERAQLFRYSVRLLNECPKARRLTNMANSGQISSKQLLELI